MALLHDAQLSIADIDYINTHGAATPAGDPVEVEGRKVFRSRTDLIPMSSTKSLHGHLLGAAGPAKLPEALVAVTDSVLADCQPARPRSGLPHGFCAGQGTYARRGSRGAAHPFRVRSFERLPGHRADLTGMRADEGP